MADRFAAARSVADATLYEGYVLYPYRASAAKNQLRWQFGVLVPASTAATDASERSVMRTECLVDPGDAPVLTVRVRFLHTQHRAVEARRPDGAFEPVDFVEVDGVRWVAWDEAVEREVDVDALGLLALAETSSITPFSFDGATSSEFLAAGDGEVRGRVVRCSEPVGGVVRVEASPADGAGAYLKVVVNVENPSTWSRPGADRNEVTRHSLVGVHTMLAIDDGAFVSLLDPPTNAAEAAAGCASEGTYPVLVGDGDEHDVVLSSPITLYDHPVVAPESQGDMCDATEIDEILALRVLTLTDEEKAEARGTDARSAAIVDRWEDMPPEVWERMHGTVRSIGPAHASAGAGAGDAIPTWGTAPEAPDPGPVPWWEPAVDASVDPWTDTLTIAGVDVAKGTKVRLRPRHRADAHDMFVAGRIATVTGVFHDVDGEQHVAVTVDDDPASAEFDWQGRFLFFHPDEIEVQP